MVATFSSMHSTELPANAARPASGRGKLFVRNLLAVGVFAVLAYPFSLQKTAEPAVLTPPHDYGALPNFHAVHTYLYRGGAPSAAGLAQLKQMGVSTVIDLRRSKQNIALERIQAEQLGLKYISLPMGNFVPAGNKQAQFFRIVESACTQPAAGKVFLHCSYGSDRTGFMVAMWRVQHDGWTIAEAAAEALKQGFIVHKFRKDQPGMFE
jgi:protein tyrosine/serine phosphatase